MASSEEYKLLNDPIHGHIELHPLVVKIIDTPQVQRLRHIHQLGANYYVFPGATHKRFDHSIGASYLAGKMLKGIKAKQPEPELEISDKDILCLQIAGLCHDLGHGPFSHLFDGMFMKGETLKWEHENGSRFMFDYLIEDEDNGFEKYFEEHPEYRLTKKDRYFIKTLIHSKPGKERAEDLTGRPEKKAFLYDIVANERNGIDVDKWDYFARDAYNVGVSRNFDHKRMMRSARVLDIEEDIKEVEDIKEDENGKEDEDGKEVPAKKRKVSAICWRDKEFTNTYDMFHTRALLHRRVYQHKTTGMIECMIADALKLADESGVEEFQLKMKLKDFNDAGLAFEKCFRNSLGGEDDKSYEKAREKLKMAAKPFMRLTDYIVQQIVNSSSTNKKIVQAQKLLERIERRDLYVVIKQIKVDKLPGKIDRKNIAKSLKEDILKTDAGENGNEIDVQEVTVSYGQKDKNPTDNVWFYKKGDPDTAYKPEHTEFLNIMPSQFMDRAVRIYSRKRKADVAELEAAKDRVEKWAKENNIP